MAITQWILGIRPTFEGLQIAPVIPRDWPGFKATRVFRRVTYRISVERAGEGNTVSLDAALNMGKFVVTTKIGWIDFDGERRSAACGVRSQAYPNGGTCGGRACGGARRARGSDNRRG